MNASELNYRLNNITAFSGVVKWNLGSEGVAAIVLLIF